jgi:hypothetical protein
VSRSSANSPCFSATAHCSPWLTTFPPFSSKRSLPILSSSPSIYPAAFPSTPTHSWSTRSLPASTSSFPWCPTRIDLFSTPKCS